MQEDIRRVVEGECEGGRPSDFRGDAGERWRVEEEEVADIELPESDEVRLQVFRVG